MLKERPIIFSSEMVLALLDGRKTMTRREVKPQPKDNLSLTLPPRKGFKCVEWGDLKGDGYDYRVCPYGEIGDRLWVRESFLIDVGGFYRFKADNENFLTDGRPWKSPLFMPRKAARVILEITNIRVERLQDITKKDADKEGFPLSRFFQQRNKRNIEWFMELWESLKGKGSWDLNPWVWVIEFKRV